MVTRDDDFVNSSLPSDPFSITSLAWNVGMKYSNHVPEKLSSPDTDTYSYGECDNAVCRTLRFSVQIFSCSDVASNAVNGKETSRICQNRPQTKWNSHLYNMSSYDVRQAIEPTQIMIAVKNYRLLSFSHRYSCLSVSGSEREWAGVSGSECG